MEKGEGRVRQDCCRNMPEALESIPGRIKTIIKAKGGHTDY